MTNYPSALNQLMQLLKKLPGVGGRTAERFAFHLLNWNQEEIDMLSLCLHKLQKEVIPCSVCRCFLDGDQCPFCSSSLRDRSKLCIIASPKDAYLIDETGAYKGLYHVLGGLLSPIQGKFSSHLDLEALLLRVQTGAIKEVILALDSTLEGDTTSLFLKEQLQKQGITVSRLALGIPMGSPLDFIDGGTLARALTGRQQFP